MHGVGLTLPTSRITNQIADGDLVELDTAYELIAHTVMSLGWTSSLVRFQSFDFGREGIRTSLEKKLNDHLDPLWIYSGNGLWIRDKASSATNQEAEEEA